MSLELQIRSSEVFLSNIDDRLVCSGGWRGLDIEYDCAESPQSSVQPSVSKNAATSKLERVSDIIGGNNSDSSESACEGFKLHEVRVMEEEEGFDHLDKLPDHLLIEILVRVRAEDWLASACVKKRWASLFQGDSLWQTALIRRWPGAGSVKRWPGPISRGSTKRWVAGLMLFVVCNVILGTRRLKFLRIRKCIQRSQDHS